MLPPRLALELEELDPSLGPEVTEEGGFVNLVFLNFATSSHYNSATTTVLVRVPLPYPDAGLDMFWTDPALLLSDGSIPKSADPTETYIGRQWRRFSWHHNGWNPAIHNLTSYIEFIRRRFNER